MTRSAAPGPVLVTGATGTLGSRVLARLEALGRPAIALSRRPSAAAGPATTTWLVADLRTGEGLDAALDGAAAVVHCATRTTGGDLALVERLLAAAARAGGAPHVVHPSIVGVDRIGLGYYRAKLAGERAVAGSGLPWTVLRATQFHEFVDRALTLLARAPVVVVPAATSVQPVAAAEVAARLVALADGPPAGRADDLAGPQVLPVRTLAAEHLASRGLRRPVVAVPLPGGAFAGYRRGDHLAGAGAVTAGPTHAEWLAAGGR